MKKETDLMTNLFEHTFLIFCDNACRLIRERLNIPEKKMWEVHANLE